MLIGYTMAQVVNWPSIYNFDGSTIVPRAALTGVAIDSSWDLMLTNGVNPSLLQAGAFTDPDIVWWSGSLGDGTIFDNCQDWTTASGAEIGTVGRASFVNDVRWMGETVQACNQLRSSMCACLQVTDTEAPTASPNANIDFIYLHNASPTNLPLSAAMGDRATTSATCATTAGALGLTCTQSWMVVAYEDDDLMDMPTTFNFNGATVPVFAAGSGIPIATVWNDMFGGNLLTTLFGAGVIVGDYVRTGVVTQSGIGSVTNQCGQWQADQPYLPTAVAQGFGWSDSMQYAWGGSDFMELFCNDDIEAVCACGVSGTAAPTPADTPFPTASPVNEVTTITAWLYNGGAAASGALGDRATTTANCLADAPTVSPALPSCLDTPMFINYNESPLDKFPDIYNFDPSVVGIVGPTGVTMAATWDDAMTSGPWSNTWNTALAATCGTNQIWTGAAPDGGSWANCQEWTIGTNRFFARSGSTTSSSAAFPLSSFDRRCDLGVCQVCLCLF